MTTLAALGSSFAAGPGIAPGGTYPHLLANRLDAKLVDLSVSGATTATILSERQRTGLRRVAPQIDGLPADADIVTITAGGNDLRFIGSMLAAALANRLDERPITIPLAGMFRGEIPVPTEADVARTAESLARVVSAARARASGARVLLVEYLTLIGPDTSPRAGIPLTEVQIEQLGAIQAGLREAYARAGAEVVGISALSEDHGLGSPEPWVRDFRGLRHPALSFHPNEAGMRAVAEEIARVLRSTS